MTKKKTKWHIVLNNSSGVKGAHKHAFASNCRTRDKIIMKFASAPVPFREAVPHVAVTQIITTANWYHFKKTHPKKARYSEKRKPKQPELIY